MGVHFGLSGSAGEDELGRAEAGRVRGVGSAGLRARGLGRQGRKGAGRGKERWAAVLGRPSWVGLIWVFLFL